jgi:hypothetical protein
MRWWALGLFVSFTFVGCKDDQDPAHAKEIWERIHAENYRGWTRAPGYPYRKPSFTAHAKAVDIYVNDVVHGAIDAQKALSFWPEGSLIVKDGYSGDDLVLVAVMEKRPDGWFWVEFDDEGAPIASGHPNVCIDCHERSIYDGTWSFGLPK